MKTQILQSMKTHFTFSTSLYVAAAAILLASCATPRAIIRMNPVSENVRWNYGQAFASDTVTGIVVEAAFDRSTPEYNIFDVTVINRSNMNYVVSPADFHFQEVRYDEGPVNIYRALDPENMLLAIDKKESKDQADAKNAAIGAVVVAGAVVATAAIVAANSNDVEVRHHHRHADPGILVATPIFLGGSNEPMAAMTEAERRRDMWANGTVRKTTLEPGYRIDGKVYFPRFEKPATYVLRLPVDEQFAQIAFNQLTFHP
jgi:hypothetical protein